MEKHYDSQLHEQQMQELWKTSKTYKTDTAVDMLYSVDTPPPTVSGSLHIGHVFSYTQTDIIVRYKRLRGQHILYPFGFDDNGLPTERFVEKQRNVQAYALGRTEFTKVCLEETALVEKEFEALWRRLGLSVDWDLCYSTIDNRCRRISQASFIELYKKGYIYRAFEPALYCTTCRTSVAQAELDQAELPSQFNDISFTTIDGDSIVIATTRPELLASCVAVFYHPDDLRYAHLKGKQAIVPVFGHVVPILPDPLVLPEKGTGLVMCCTFGDKTDVAWFKTHQFEFRQSIGIDGKMLEKIPFIGGMRVASARETILQKLAELNVLGQQRKIVHAVQVHERCKKEIEYQVLSQWFLKLIAHKEQLLAAADQIEWYPAFMKSRYRDWVSNLSWDWCLSRQRFFGIPFPVWHCQECKEIILPQEADLPIDPLEKAYGKPCPKCASLNVSGDTDVMDTWNTSSITPEICLDLYKTNGGSGEFLPMAMRPQAHDIIRTWAFYTIAKSWFARKQVPWKQIVISGHVLADKNEKISKSRGNSKFSPIDLLTRFPADAIRYWTASAGMGQDVSFSETQIKLGQRLLTKLWNAFKFIGEHAQFVAEPHEPVGRINQWLLESLRRTVEMYDKHFAQHELNHALDAVEKFFWHTLCDTYLEIVKDTLFHPELYDPEFVGSVRSTLYDVGLAILQLYAPFIPHLTELLYQQQYRKHSKKHSLHQLELNRAYTSYEVAYQEAVVIKLIVEQVRKLKTDAQLSLRVPLVELIVCASMPLYAEIIKTDEQLLKGATGAQQLVLRATHSSEKSELKQDADQYRAIVVLE